MFTRFASKAFAAPAKSGVSSTFFPSPPLPPPPCPSVPATPRPHCPLWRSEKRASRLFALPDMLPLLALPRWLYPLRLASPPPRPPPSVFISRSTAGGVGAASPCRARLLSRSLAPPSPSSVPPRARPDISLPLCVSRPPPPSLSHPPVRHPRAPGSPPASTSPRPRSRPSVLPVSTPTSTVPRRSRRSPPRRPPCRPARRVSTRLRGPSTRRVGWPPLTTLRE